MSMFKVNVVVVNPKREEAFSHGVAEEGSPRREPWGKICRQQKPRQGRQNWGQTEFSFAASRLRLSIPQPTADAVGYLLPLLRSYLPPLSTTRGKIKPQKLTEVSRKIRSISAKL